MTNEEIAAGKTKAIVLFGLGLAAFVAAYLVPENDTVQLAIGVGLVLVGIICMVAAGKIAKSLKPESAAK